MRKFLIIAVLYVVCLNAFVSLEKPKVSAVSSSEK
jgi:hypothetical protein